MSDPYLGEIRAVAFSYAPRGWMLCQGQTLAISQNSALFSLLGTTYGGNGTTTFQLPNLCGRSMVGTGQGPGLPLVVQGEVGGSQNVTLTQNQMPIHTHVPTANVTVSLPAHTGVGSTAVPTGAVPASVVLEDGRTTLNSYAAAPGDTTLAAPTVSASVTIGTAGGSQPVSILNPFLGMNYVIATEGIFPSRN